MNDAGKQHTVTSSLLLSAIAANTAIQRSSDTRIQL